MIINKANANKTDMPGVQEVTFAAASSMAEV
jgi:hypothetical protein